MYQFKIEKNNITSDSILNILNNIERIHNIDYDKDCDIAYVNCDKNGKYDDEIEIIPNLLTKTKKINYLIKLKAHLEYPINLLNFPNACKFIGERCPYIVEYFLEKKPELIIEYMMYFDRTQTNNEVATKVEKLNQVQRAFTYIMMLEPFVFISMVMKFYQQDEFKKFQINGTKQSNIIFKEFEYINKLFSNPDPILSTYKIDDNSECMWKVGNVKTFSFADQAILSANNFSLYQKLPELKLIDYIANR